MARANYNMELVLYKKDEKSSEWAHSFPWTSVMSLIIDVRNEQQQAGLDAGGALSRALPILAKMAIHLAPQGQSTCREKISENKNQAQTPVKIRLRKYSSNKKQAPKIRGLVIAHAAIPQQRCESYKEFV